MHNTREFLERLEKQEFIQIPDKIEVTQGKQYNECLNCKWFGDDCSGPNMVTMTVDRISEFLQYLRLMNKWSYQKTADECGLALVTVQRTLTGKIKNPEFLTIQCLFEGLMKGSGNYPCTKRIYTKQVAEVEQQMKDLQDKHSAELASKTETIAELRDRITEYRDASATYRSTIADLRAQIKKYEAAAKKAQKQQG